jgi:hypothetical protein
MMQHVCGFREARACARSNVAISPVLLLLQNAGGNLLRVSPHIFLIQSLLTWSRSALKTTAVAGCAINNCEPAAALY